MLTLEGAMGTMLQKQGIPAGECPEFLNVLDPEVVLEVHKYYHIAGAQCAISNTFGGTRAKLAEYGLEDRLVELNVAGVMLAKDQHPEHVLADVGPCGLVMQPLGKATFEEVFAQYFEQVSALAKAEPDAILIETMVDIADARAAVLAAHYACDLPIIVSCTFNEAGRMDLSGTDPQTAAIILEAAGAHVIGLNCGLGPQQMYPLLCQMATATNLPLLIQANAGLPLFDERTGRTVFPGTADEMAAWALRFREAGAQFIGSCCGSTPAFTGAIHAEIAYTDVVPHKADRLTTILAGPHTRAAIGPGQPVCLLGERINPTGKKQLAEELLTGSMSTVSIFAQEQIEAGAHILDVNVGAAGVDAREALPLAVKTLVGTGMPLSLDTTDPEALERALRIYPGRALINSCNGEASSYEAVLPLAKQYGAAVVVLALDEQGIPATVEGRLAIIERVRKAAHAYGLNDKDLIVDSLVMTAAADKEAAHVTLDTLRAVHEKGIATVLGVSNISHGLPDRPLLNAAFVRAAVAAGLDLAIANPNDAVVCETIRTASDARMEGTLDFETAYSEWLVVYEAAVNKAAAGIDEITRERGGRPSIREGQESSPKEALAQAVLRGDSDGAPVLVERAIASGIDPLTIIPDILTPAIQQLGDAYGEGKVFLPQMMVAADAMKAAVKRTKEYLPTREATKSAGTVVFCTVKGDIHSIGKDICISLLESQGFEVDDLGVDVAAEEVLAAVRKRDADVVCLSALMTTTLPAMKETAQLVAREQPACAVLVGGAVVTSRWAKSIGARYSSDAPDCVQAVRAYIQERCEN
jgi:5-methyltetrahydrofolate--homocysteine methyltransferase